MFGQGQRNPFAGQVFGSAGASTVFGSGPGAFVVTGSNGHDGAYFQSGGTVVGPDGVHTVISNGQMKTIVGPDGSTHVLFDAGSGTSTLL